MMLARVLRSESGSALPTALAVLAAMGALTGAVATGSVRLSNTSDASRDAKRALAAADAGVEAALYRLNRQPQAQEGQSSSCFTTQLVQPTAGECPGQTETLPNGTSYTYYVTPVLSSGATCAGLPLTETEQNGVRIIVQRCVTSIGMANGQRRRVQARIASYEGAPIFPKPGVLGLNGVIAVNNSSIDGYLGSNRTVQVGNNTVVGTVELGPNGQFTHGSGTQVQNGVVPRTPAQGDFVLSPIDFGNSATVNNNTRISGPPVLDASTGTTYVDTATSPRTLTMGNGATLTLGGGTYNFCKLTMGNNSTITIAAGARVRIFIDSPDRTGSGCTPKNSSGVDLTPEQWKAAGFGTMVMGQGANLVNTNREDALQLYIYGWDDGTQVIEFQNSAKLNLAIYAPQTKIVFKNSGVVNGGVAAREVEFKNGAFFTWGASLAELRAETLALYYRTAWKECRRLPTVTTDPESGCNGG